MASLRAAFRLPGLAKVTNSSPVVSTTTTTAPFLSFIVITIPVLFALNSTHLLVPPPPHPPQKGVLQYKKTKVWILTFALLCILSQVATRHNNTFAASAIRAYSTKPQVRFATPCRQA
jgi:hypothetical protein